MKNKIDIRSYEKKDEFSHIDLMWNSSTHVRNIQYWRWINSDLWGYEPVIKYATFRGKIIGSYTINPVDLLFKDEVIKAGFATQVLVHSEHRDLSIINDLNTSIVDSCAKESVDFIFGFPNNSIWNVNLRLFGWKDAGRIKYLKLNRVEFHTLNTNSTAFFINEKNLYILDSFMSEINNNINKNIINYKISLDWFKWRFFDNPLQYYKVVCVEINNNIQGILTLKNYHTGNKLVGHIVYIKVLPVNNDVLSSLMAKAFDYFNFVGASEVTMWKTDDNWIVENLKKIGFSLTDYYTNFGFKPIKMKNINSVPNVNDWNISMSNSDAF